MTTGPARPSGRPGIRPAPVAAALTLAALAGAVVASFAPAESPSRAVPAEPAGLRRILLTPDQVPGMLAREREGVLRSLPRSEFEDLLKRALGAADAARHPPRLAEARYRARLVDAALVGTGQWKVVHAARGAGLLPLQPLNLALRHPRFENYRDALIADFDGKAPSLLLDGPGDPAVVFEWSARAEERPEGLHFDLRFPACPVAALELDLPADRVAAAADGSLLAGPAPAEAADRHLWRVGCGARPGVDFWVRPGGPAAAATLLLGRQSTTQNLEPEGLDATYQFDLDVLHHEVDALQLECDPELRPYEVVVPGLDRWELLSAPPGGGPAVLAVRLREPLRHGTATLLVRCLAPLRAGVQPHPASGVSGAAPPPVRWRSPGVRLKGAAPRGETITLTVDPDLRVDELEAGDFRLAENTPAALAGGAAGRRFTFVGGAVAGAGGSPRRPGARVQPYAVEYRARQLVWWQPAGSPPSITAQVACEVERGKLFQVPVLLPPGWDVERVEMTPAGLLRTWSVRPLLPEAVPADAPGGGEGRYALLVDLQQPLTKDARERGEGIFSGMGALFGRSRVPTLLVRLVPKHAATEPGGPLLFPDLLPLGVRIREGILAIGCDPQAYQLALKASVPEAEVDEDGPWGRQAPDAAYRYRGQPIEGTLALQPRPPRVRARCVSDVYLPAGRAAVNTRLILEAESGSPNAVEVSFSAASHPAASPRPPDEHGHDGWEWRVEQGDNAVRSFERYRAGETAEGLAALAGASPPGVAALLAARPAGERWLLTLDKPLQPHAPLILHAARRLEPEARRWDVPLPSVPGARRMDGEVTLHLAGAEFVQVEASGLQEAPPAQPAAGRSRIGTPWRTFRYGDGPASLVLQGRGAAVDRTAEAVADRARLTTYLADDGAARHHFSFRVSNWTQRTLPLRLPPGARPVAVRADGHSVCAFPAGTTAEAGVLELPVPRTPAGTGDGSLRFEVIYDTAPPPGGGWRPWTRLESPAPVLPIPALTFRRSWRLPPDVAPVSDGQLRPLPGVGKPTGDGVPRALSERFLLTTPLSEALAEHPAASGQAEGLAAAAAGLRPKAGRQVARLRDMIAELSTGFLNGRLVVDDAALRELGLGTESLLSVEPLESATDRSAPWEAAGLVAVGAGPATLLTTAIRSHQWGQEDDPPAPVKAAVVAALANGHDASGYYRTAADWVRHAGEHARDTGAEALPEIGPALTPWTEWEPLAGVADDDAIVVVRRELMLAGGILLAAALALVLGVARRRDVVLTVWLGVSGLAALWLPTALQPLAWLPFLAGSLAAVVGYLRAVARWNVVPRLEPGGAARVGLTALLLALAAVCRPGTANEVPAATVYLLGSGTDERVLAPTELLDRLETLSRAGPEGAGPVLLAASYDGKPADGVMLFDAVFEAYCPAGPDAALALPLDGVYLEGDVLVDGARALPAALPAPQAGFSVPLHTAGRHRIELRFRVPVLDEVGGQGVRFGAPRVCQNHLRLALPPGATAARALVKHGAQRVSTENGHPVLEAELGRVTAPLHFCWARAGQPGTVEVAENYFWDLTAEAATLTGWLDYHVAGGNVATLAVELPPGLEVRRAEARRVGAGEPVRLRDWRTTGADPKRVLELELVAPTAGTFQVGLALVPKAPLEAEVTLPLPTPRGKAYAGTSHLAYRAAGVRAALVSTRWLTGGSADAFAPSWPEAVRPDLPATTDDVAVYAATFHRESGQEPLLRVRLTLPTPRLRVERQDVTMHVFPRHAEVEAALRVAMPDGTPPGITCLLHPQQLTVSGVRGDGVQRWKQVGDKLLVWFEGGKPGDHKQAASLQITGWLPAEGEAGRLAIPSLRVDTAAVVQQASVRLTPEAGLTLAPAGLNGLRPVPAAEPDVALVAERPDYEGQCEVRAAAAGTAVRVLTVVEVRDRKLAFRATAEFLVQRGDLRATTVRLRNWEGEDVKLGVEKAVPLRQRERRRAANDRTWALELRPGATGKVRVSLSGSVPLEEAVAGLPMPNVTVLGSGTAESLVAVAGGDLLAEGADGLTPGDVRGATLKDWPAEAGPLRLTGGQVWQVAREDWTLRLRPRGGAGAGPVQLLLADHTAALSDGRHWLHEAVYWVRHGANTDLNVVLPKPGTVVALAVDGVDMAPLQPERRRLWLPLPGRAGVRAVRLRWRYDDPADPMERPLLQTPVIEGAVEGPGVWTVYLPMGFDANAGRSLAPKSGPARAAAVALYRAAAQLRVSETLMEASPDGSTAPAFAAQQRFYAYCRQADQLLQVADDDPDERGPDGETYARWLQSLLDENRQLARDRKLEELRADAERRADDANAAPRLGAEEGEPGALTGLGAVHFRGSLPDVGTPAYLGTPEASALPQLTIRPDHERLARETVAKTAAWAGLFVVITALVLTPRLRDRLYRFWPEALLLPALVAGYRMGVTPAVALLLLLGAGGRLLVIARGIRRWLERQPPPRAAGSTVLPAPGP